MAIYGSRRKRATKKARAKKKAAAGTRTAASRPKKAAPAQARARNAKRAARSARTATAKRKTAPKRAKAVARTVPARAKKASVTKKTSPRSAGATVAAKKRPTKAEREAEAKRLQRNAKAREGRQRRKKEAEAEARKKEDAKKARTAKRVEAKKATAREAARVQRQLAGLRQVQQEDRGKGKKSPARKAVLKRQISEERVQGAQAIARPDAAWGPAADAQFRNTEFARLRERFWKLFSKAVTTGQTPGKTRLPRRVSSRQFVGEQRRIRVERILTPELVVEVMHKVDQSQRKFKGTYPIWWAGLAFSGLGERLFGSGNQVLVSDDQDARFFQAQGYDNTGVYGSYPGMRDALEAMLDDYASEPRTTVYLHFVWLRNVERRRAS